MDFSSSLQRERLAITTYLESFFAEKRSRWSGVNQWGPDALERLESFMRRGKMVRGALVLLTADALGGDRERALHAAAAMEFLQASLLVHDDIMDEDEVRRGAPSMHRQYREIGVDLGVSSFDRFGESMAVCVGDLSLFLAYECLSQAGDASLVALFCRRASVVGLGQMQDVFWGAGDEVPSQEEVLSMYEHKTAMYTFCLPFLLGARLAGADEGLAGRLDDLGRLLGKLFQLRDDDLGLFGDRDELGKSVGVDLAGGKKTVHFSLLLSFASEVERRRLLSLRGSACDDDDLRFVTGLLERYDVRSLVRSEVEVLLAASSSLIGGLRVPVRFRTMLNSLLEFIVERTS